MLGQIDKMNIRRIKIWVPEIIHWLYEAHLVILCCTICSAAFLFAFYTWPYEESIRASGFFLQILGMFFAVRGALRIRAHFGHRPLMKLAKEWFLRFPKWKRNVVVSVGSVTLGMHTGKARAEVWNPDNPKNPAEKRLDAMLLNIERLRESQRRILEQIDKINENHVNSKKESEQARKILEQELRTELESLHTDDVLTSLIGLIWLSVGITMSTMSQEIAKMFNMV